MAKTKTPWLLCIKFYWKRLAIVSIIWFIYDFSAYAFGIYSSSILANLLGDNTALWKSFGWNVLINFFYMPGCIAGAFLADRFGPKWTLAAGVIAQGVVGFIMAGCYGPLSRPENIAGFVIVYGIFLALGELGPGDNIGLVASKTSATSIRYEPLSGYISCLPHHAFPSPRFLLRPVSAVGSRQSTVNLCHMQITIGLI
jgi:MFS family permease